MKTALLFLVLAVSLFGNNGNDKNYFIENKGQWPAEVKYLARIGGMNAWITNTGVVQDYFKLKRNYSEKQLAKMSASKANEYKINNSTIYGHVIKMQLVDVNPAPSQQPENIQNAYYNYFGSNDKSKWVSHVPLYGDVLINNIYDNINIKYYFDGNSIRYDYIVKPGADLSKLKIKFEGQESLSINNAGELVIKTSLGDVTNGELFSYQVVNKIKNEVSCGFIQNQDGTISLNAKDYDKSKELIIDPLVYSTFLGGNFGEWIYSVKTDIYGFAYVTGNTRSSAFPTTVGAYSTTYSDNFAGDVFVSKVNPSGSDLVYSTFIGVGSGYSIAINDNGNAYVTGLAGWPFPTTPGAYNVLSNGPEVFITELSPAGDNLVFSTFIGVGHGNSIAIDASGNSYVTGNATSADYPTTVGAIQSAYNGPSWMGSDAFVSKLNPDGTALIYSTYLGGTGYDQANGIAVDPAGNAFVAGWTQSSDFPTTAGSYRPTAVGSAGYADVFVSKINPTGTALVYSTYLGGTSEDEANSLALDAYGNAHVAGTTWSVDFPMTGGVIKNWVPLGGYSHVFITKVNATGSDLLYSTYVTSTGADKCQALALDPAGNAYITGNTSWSDFPTTVGAYQTYIDGSGVDSYMAKINSTATGLYYSTFLGGNDYDLGSAITIDAAGNIFIAGSTGSVDFPTTAGAYQSVYPNQPASASPHGFLTKFSIPNPSMQVASPNGNEFWVGGSSQIISWNQLSVATVKIEYSTDNGSSWNLIVDNLPTLINFYDWTVPNILSFKCKIRVSDAANNAVYDISDNTFTLWKIVQAIVQPVPGQNYLDFSGTDILLNLFLNSKLKSSPKSIIDLTASYYKYSAPAPGTLPDGVNKVSDYYWTITSSDAVSCSNGQIEVPLDSLRGVIDPAQLVWLKRDNSGDPWINIGGTITSGKLVSNIPFSTFYEFAIGSMDGSPLPVQLTSFTAEQKDGAVNLTWKTNNELQNSGFDIERKSVSDKQFSKIGFIKGAGNSSTPKQYSFSDNSVLNGKYYYRLRMVNNDGQSSYSNETELTITPSGFVMYQNYPNPFNPETNIKYAVPVESNIIINIYNSLGENIRTINQGIKQPGYYDINFNSNGLSSGIYFYNMKAVSLEGKINFTSVKKMIHMK